MGLSWSFLLYICSSEPSNLSFLNLQSGSLSPSYRVYYNIEIINHINIYPIFILATGTHSTTHNAEVALMLNRNADLHVFLGFDDQAQKLFWNLLKIKSPQQSNTGINHALHLVWFIISTSSI